MAQLDKQSWRSKLTNLLPPFVKCRISIISAPRHYCISQDKNVQLTFSPTLHPPHPAHHRRLASSSHFYPPSPSYVPPHLYPPPPISFGVWPHLRLLIHCPVSGSIERLSVTGSHCTSFPPPPRPLSASPQTADAHPAKKSSLFSFSPPPNTFILLSLDHFFMSAPET